MRRSSLTAMTAILAVSTMGHGGSASYAPAVYDASVPFGGHGSRNFGGEGRPVAWVVERSRAVRRSKQTHPGKRGKRGLG